MIAIVRSIIVAFLMFIILGEDHANKWVIYCTVFMLGYFQGCFGALKISSHDGCSIQQLKRISLIREATKALAVTLGLAIQAVIALN